MTSAIRRSTKSILRAGDWGCVSRFRFPPWAATSCSTMTRKHPTRLNATFAFEAPHGKRKMMELEVRHWITNHEAEIGTGAYGAAAFHAAGLTPQESPRISKFWARKMLKPTPSAISSTDQTVTSAIDGYDAYKTWLTDQVEPGPSGKASGDHLANFIDCVRSRRAEDLHCPIEEGHISTTLVHLANTSYRLGRTLQFDPEQEQVIGDEEATRCCAARIARRMWCRKKCNFLHCPW